MVPRYMATVAAWLVLGAGCAATARLPAWSETGFQELAMPVMARGPTNETARYRLTVAGIGLAQFELTQQHTPAWLVITGVTKQDGLGALFDQIRSEFSATLRREGSALVPARFAAKEPMTAHPAQDEQVDVVYSVTGAEISLLRPGTAPIAESQVLTSRHRFDLGSFLFAMRWLDTAKGQQVVADVVRSRFAWRSQLTDAGITSLHTSVGTFRAKRYDGRSRRLRRDGTVDPSGGERTYSMWISDDADRVLLKLSAVSDVGAVELVLVHYAQQ